MALGLIGRKVAMTQIFSSEGEIIPVTVIKAGPCPVTQKKTKQRDGYTALQLGFEQTKPEKLSRPRQGHFKNSGKGPYVILREFRSEHSDGYDVGHEFTVDLFKPGEKVKITGTSKGKGFAGNIKRWGFHRGPMTHGSKFHRACGTTGMSAWPSKVLKGRKMPGQKGSVRTSTRGIEIIDTRADDNLLFVRGAVPGAKNGVVMIYKLNDEGQTS